MASFETVSARNINEPSYGEIQEFAIDLKVRFGVKAASTADYFVQKHQETGDFLRAEMWQAVSSSIKANDAARSSVANKVNVTH